MSSTTGRSRCKTTAGAIDLNWRHPAGSRYDRAVTESASTSTAPLPPHSELSDYYQGEKRSFVRRMFDESAPDYDRLEQYISFGSGRWYRRRALRRGGLREGMKAVDVATGTGLVAREAATLVGEGGRVLGVDPSKGMIGQVGEIDRLSLNRGLAEALPFADDSFDFLSMGYALRHVEDLRATFAEFRRVLKPGGRMCILEITPARFGPANFVLRAHLRSVVPALLLLTGRGRSSRTLMRYYWDTIAQCVPPDRVLAAMRDAGLPDASRFVELGIFSEYTATA